MMEEDRRMWERVGGVWQRVSLEVPTGRTTDVATAVWWLQIGHHPLRVAADGDDGDDGQVPKLFADLRIPPRASPYSDGRACEVSLRDVLRQRASAGVLDCARLSEAPPPSPHATDAVPPPDPEYQCTWHCHLDYHPPSGEADVGNAAFVDEMTMLETGVHSDYREIWIRRDDGREQIGMELIEECSPSSSDEGILSQRPRRGVWIVSGRYFAQVVDRYVLEEDSIGHRIANAKSPSLGELLQNTWQMPPDEQRRVATLFVSCFGVIDSTCDGVEWKVIKSTDPALEGTVFFSNRAAQDSTTTKPRSLRLERTDAQEQILIEKLADGTLRRWRILINTCERQLW